MSGPGSITYFLKGRKAEINKILKAHVRKLRAAKRKDRKEKAQ